MQAGEVGQKNLAHRHCSVDGNWDFSMCERSWGPAGEEEGSYVIKVRQRPTICLYQDVSLMFFTSHFYCSSKFRRWSCDKVSDDHLGRGQVGYPIGVEVRVQGDIGRWEWNSEDRKSQRRGYVSRIH